MSESKSCAHIENINLNFAEVHNKRYFVQEDGVIDNDSKNINLTSLSKDYYIEKEREFFIKGGNGATKKVNFKGLDYDRLFDEIKQNYKETTGKDWKSRKGPKVGKEQIFKEMTVNTKSNTSAEDLNILQKQLNKNGITVLEISLHNDEGHINENGDKEYNHHAHIIFANCNSEGIVKRWQKKDYQHLQDIVATALDMERGERGSKAKRLSSQQYKAVKKNETELLKEQKQLITELKSQVKNLEQLNKSTSKQYEEWNDRYIAENSALKKQLKQVVNIEAQNKQLKNELNETNKSYNKLHDKMNELNELFNSLGLDNINVIVEDMKDIKKKLLDKLNEDYKRAREELKQSNIATQQNYQRLKQDKEQKSKVIKSTLKEIEPDL